jgi:hypothetical protein
MSITYGYTELESPLAGKSSKSACAEIAVGVPGIEPADPGCSVEDQLEFHQTPYHFATPPYSLAMCGVCGNLRNADLEAFKTIG